MNGKERILITLQGGCPDRVPFVPNIWQWFHVNHRRGTLPEVLRPCPSPLAALRLLGAEIMSKFDGNVLVEDFGTCRQTVAFEDDGGARPEWTSFTSFEGGNLRRETLETPAGRLTHAWQYEPQTGAPFEVEHWWKDFDREYPAVRAWLAEASWRLDREAVRRGLSAVGDDGIVLCQLPPTPLKRLFWLAGPEQTAFFLADYPQEMQALVRMHETAALAAVETVVDLDEVWAFEWPENLDSMFYSPAHFRAFCLPVMRRAAEMIHARGKFMFAHACGRLKALEPLILEAGLDCVEGQAHPPIGDWRLDEARRLSDDLIVCGGMTAREQEWSEADAALRIDQHVRDLFASLGSRRRFLFGSGCNTSPRTPWANLLAFRDAAWKYGRFADLASSTSSLPFPGGPGVR